LSQSVRAPACGKLSRSGVDGVSPRIIACGDAAFAVEFGSDVDPEVNAQVLALDAALMAQPIPGVVETVPTYRSLLVHVDPLSADIDAISRTVLDMARTTTAQQQTARRWRIPVAYGGEFGIDLEDVAARHGISPAELISRHSAPVYRVYMVGFMPGFSYLGGLDQRIATPRRESPRLKTPAGSVTIGGVQAAVASVEAPSGWHLLGRTPVRTFMVDRDPVFLLAPGDEVTFAPIDAAEWSKLDVRAAAGDPVAERVA
jgi:KipI family sensor histidine kinase inhibitor